MRTDDTGIMRHITFTPQNKLLKPPKHRKGRPRTHCILQTLEETMEHQFDQLYDHNDELHLTILFNAADERLF